MSDTREYMISDERKAALDNEAAIADAKAILTAAGFRILGPDELDPVTLKKAAEVPETFHEPPDNDEEPGDDTWWARKARNGCLARVAAAIRAMQGGKP